MSQSFEEYTHPNSESITDGPLFVSGVMRNHFKECNLPSDGTWGENEQKPPLDFTGLNKEWERVCEKHNLSNPPKDSILEQAQKIIDEDREQTHGDPASNIQTIANFWSEYLDTEVSMDDVCNMMVLLKVARLKSNALHVDSDVDAAGYLYLKHKIRQERQ